MKSFHHASGEESLHFLVEQDAAIDDYLAGLLNDLGDTAMTATPSAVDPFLRKTNPVGLAIVTRSSVDDVERTGAAILSEHQEPRSTDRFDAPVDTLNLDLPEDADEEATDLPMLNAEPQSSVEALQSDAPHAEAPVVADSEPVTTMPIAFAEDESVLSIQEPVSVAPGSNEPVGPEIVPATKPWRIFAIGGVKVGLPVGEIYDVLTSPSIEPLKGAPAHVAGTVLHQGRRRMVLSLASWFPGAVVATPHVILLGADGLWGVEVGHELMDLPWDESMTQWRSDDERAGARPWLAGVNRSAGVAFLTVPALRAALKSSR